jgi:uncharacterized protein YndB with AHSA1/START domain
MASEANETNVATAGDRELVVTRRFAAPTDIVFKAWARPELFQRWWIPKSAPMTLLSCEMDVRTGGTYRLVIQHPAMEQPMAFFGSYIEVVPNERIVWTNEESPDGAVTTVTFEDHGDTTLLTLRERYSSKAARDEAIQGSAAGLPEQFEQLDDLLPSLH